MPVVSLEENEKNLNLSSEITAREDVKPESLIIGKKSVELLEETEKRSSLSPEVTVNEDLKPEYMDLVKPPSSSSFIFKFSLPSNNNSWLVSTSLFCALFKSCVNDIVSFPFTI